MFREDCGTDRERERKRKREDKRSRPEKHGLLERERKRVSFTIEEKREIERNDDKTVKGETDLKNKPLFWGKEDHIGQLTKWMET